MQTSRARKLQASRLAAAWEPRVFGVVSYYLEKNSDFSSAITMSVSLQPSSSLGFNRMPPVCLQCAETEVFSYRTTNSTRQTYSNNHQSQCATSRLQSQNYCSKSMCIPLSNDLWLTPTSSCTAYDQIQGEWIRGRALRFKVSYLTNHT